MQTFRTIRWSVVRGRAVLAAAALAGSTAFGLLVAQSPDAATVTTLYTPGISDFGPPTPGPTDPTAPAG
jgi:hypothetical protein